MFSAITGGRVFKLMLPSMKHEWSYPIHKANINQMTMVTGEKCSCLLTCSDDMWIKILDCYDLHRQYASYYVGAQVTGITGFFEGDDLFIQCTDSHGRVSVLKTTMQLRDPENDN